MRVAVVGAGMGGLLLAQALVRAGDRVEVFDRDPEVSATGGYRLHLNARACAALRRHLAPEVFQAVQASSAGPAAFRRFSVVDHRLRLLVSESQRPDDERLLIGRVQLRRLLATGLGDRLHFGRRYTHHAVLPDQTVQVCFADGSSTSADLLVGADGVGSRVAAALAGHETSQSVGLAGIAGRTALTERTRPLVPRLLQHGPALAVGPGGVGLFLTWHDPAVDPLVDPAACVTVPADIEGPTFIWGVIAAERSYPGDVRSCPRLELSGVAGGLLSGWDENVRELVRRSDADSAAYFQFRAAHPGTDLTPWAAHQVTALGDAVHAMPPTGGQSAATAIRDADALAARLTGVRAGQVTLATALRDFHADMAGYAPAAVRESLAPVAWIHALSRPGAAAAARLAFPVAAGLASAGRGLRSGLGGPGRHRQGRP